MRFSSEECLQKFLMVYDAVPSGDRENLPFEAIFLASEVPVNEFLGAMIISFQTIQAQKSAMIAMAGHPNVVRKSLEFAEKPGGVQDRRMLHEAVRFVPTSKGTTFNLNLPGSAPQPTKHESKNEPDEEMDVNDTFPMITENQANWQDNRQKLLKDKN